MRGPLDSRHDEGRHSICDEGFVRRRTLRIVIFLLQALRLSAAP